MVVQVNTSVVEFWPAEPDVLAPVTYTLPSDPKTIYVFSVTPICTTLTPAAVNGLSISTATVLAADGEPSPKYVLVPHV